MTPFLRERHQMSRLRAVPTIIKEQLLSSRIRDERSIVQKKEAALVSCINLAGRGWHDVSSPDSFQGRLTGVISNPGVQSDWVSRSVHATIVPCSHSWVIWNVNPPPPSGGPHTHDRALHNLKQDDSDIAQHAYADSRRSLRHGCQRLWRHYATSPLCLSQSLH